MSSFVQGLLLTHAFVWRISNLNIKLKSHPSNMDEEGYEFGKKVVELLRKQIAFGEAQMGHALETVSGETSDAIRQIKNACGS